MPKNTVEKNGMGKLSEPIQQQKKGETRKNSEL